MNEAVVPTSLPTRLGVRTTEDYVKSVEYDFSDAHVFFRECIATCAIFFILKCIFQEMVDGKLILVSDDPNVYSLVRIFVCVWGCMYIV